MLFLLNTFSDKDRVSLGIVGHCCKSQVVNFFPELNICLSVISSHWS